MTRLFGVFDEISGRATGIEGRMAAHKSVRPNFLPAS
jgi:hypothetical protein